MEKWAVAIAGINALEGFLNTAEDGNMKFHARNVIYHGLSALAGGAAVACFLLYKGSSPHRTLPAGTEKTALRTPESPPDRKPTGGRDPLWAAIEAGARPGAVNAVLIDECKKALANSSGSQRTRRFISVLELMRPEDAPQVRALFRTEDVRMGRMDDIKSPKFEVEWDAFWSRWGEIDAPGAMQNLVKSAESGIGDDIGVSRVAGLVMKTWGASNPDAARAWFGDMDVGKASTLGIVQMMGGWAERDVLAALEHIISPEISPRIRDHYFNEVTKTAAQRRDKTVFGKYLQMLPDDTRRAQAMPSFVNSQLQDDPHAARRLIDLYPELDWKGRYVLPKLVMDLAQSDPAGATQWAAGLRASIKDNGKAKAVFQGFAKWLETDTASATAWLSTQDGQAWYDPSVLHTAEFLVNGKHPEAAAWVEAVRDPAKKTGLQQRMQERARRSW